MLLFAICGVRNKTMDEVSKTIFYLFVMGMFLIAVAYWAGTQKILNTIFTNVNTLDLTATGRDSSGKFAAYPTNGPTS